MSVSGVQARGSLGFLIAMLILAGALPRVGGERLLLAVSLSALVWLAGTTAVRKKRSFADQWPVVSMLGGAVIMVLMILYTINPTHQWVEGMGALPVEHVRFLPGSAFPQGTWKVLLFAVSMSTAVALAFSLQRNQTNILLIATAAAAAITALWVIGQRLAPRPWPVFPTTGFFLYENHFAAFANLLIPVGLACGTRARCRAFQKGKVSSPAALFYWAVLLMALAVVLSRSRAGIAIACFLFFGFVLILKRLQHRYPFALPPPLIPKLSGWLLPGGLFVGLIAAGVYFAWDQSEPLAKQMSFRWQVLTDTFSVFRAHPWWGTGPGSFEAVFPYYQTEALAQHYFSHAHCDPLEFLSEYGLLGTGVVIAGVSCIVLFGKKRPVQMLQQPPFYELEGHALVLALIGIGLHGLVDFPFHHPLNALLAAVWIGILFRRNVKKQSELDT